MEAKLENHPHMHWRSAFGKTESRVKVTYLVRVDLVAIFGRQGFGDANGLQDADTCHHQGRQEQLAEVAVRLEVGGRGGRKAFRDGADRRDLHRRESVLLSK